MFDCETMLINDPELWRKCISSKEERENKILQLHKSKHVIDIVYLVVEHINNQVYFEKIGVDGSASLTFHIFEPFYFEP